MLRTGASAPSVARESPAQRIAATPVATAPFVLKVPRLMDVPRRRGWMHSSLFNSAFYPERRHGATA